MFKSLCAICLLGLTTLSAIDPQEAFNKLIEGNKRFQQNQSLNPNQDLAKREAVSTGQSPFAIIVACSDSRVAPEILFDQGIGDIFVIRVAGNVVGPLEMESIEYAAKVLGASCIIVMGHQRCGAVNAVIQDQTGDIRYISQLIRPAVTKAKGSPQDILLKKATHYNATNVCEFISQSPIISELLTLRQIIVRAAYYDFDTGLVEILP